VGAGTVPYLGKYLIATLQQFISTAYKQFHQLKCDNNNQDTWIAQLISTQAVAWNHTKSPVETIVQY